MYTTTASTKLGARISHRKDILSILTAIREVMVQSSIAKFGFRLLIINDKCSRRKQQWFEVMRFVWIIELTKNPTKYIMIPCVYAAYNGGAPSRLTRSISCPVHTQLISATCSRRISLVILCSLPTIERTEYPRAAMTAASRTVKAPFIIIVLQKLLVYLLAEHSTETAFVIAPNCILNLTTFPALLPDIIACVSMASTAADRISPFTNTHTLTIHLNTSPQ